MRESYTRLNVPFTVTMEIPREEHDVEPLTGPGRSSTCMQGRAAIRQGGKAHANASEDRVAVRIDGGASKSREKMTSQT